MLPKQLLQLRDENRNKNDWVTSRTSSKRNEQRFEIDVVCGSYCTGLYVCTCMCVLSCVLLNSSSFYSDWKTASVMTTSDLQGGNEHRDREIPLRNHKKVHGFLSSISSGHLSWQMRSLNSSYNSLRSTLHA